MLVCPICCEENIDEFDEYAEYDENNYYLNCNHKYCKYCIRQYVVQKLNDNEHEIFCPCYSCDNKFNDNIIKIILNTDYDNIYNEHYWNMYMNNKTIDAEKFYCKCPKCNQMCKLSEKNNAVYCSNCYDQFCNICNSFEHHSNYYLCHNEHTINQKLEELQLALKIDSELIKACPVCKIIIYKESGCTAVKCTNCKTKFCWGCLKTHRTINKLDEHFCKGIYEFNITYSDNEYTDGYSSGSSSSSRSSY
jgi:ariadne-1